MSFFRNVPLAPPDPILGLTAAFLSDTRPDKVNLGVGLYKGEDLVCPVMRCVKEVEKRLIEVEKSKEYLPIEGDPQFVALLGELVFSTHFSERICGVQAVGGTSALHLGGAFIKQELSATVYISHPTWPNHAGVFRGVGLPVENYPYYDIGSHRLQFEKMVEFLSLIPQGSIVVLHASCHNPTGVDLTLEQWNTLAGLFQEKGLFPFFDCAYQGFGKGLHEDVQAIRLFAEKGIEMMVAVSNSKNFSLYGERIGALFLVTASKELKEKALSRMKQLVRIDYSNPPIHGARIVAHVLGDAGLRALWEKELDGMRQRIHAMRKELSDLLSEERFNYLQKCLGMFCYSGLNPEQVKRLREEFGIYMTGDGRINVCGLNRENIRGVSQAMRSVL